MGRSKTKTNNGMFIGSAKSNKYSYMTYYEQLLEIAISRFEWLNLPDTVDERFLEIGLNTNGMMLFFKDDDIGFLGLPTTIGGQLNVYNIPISRRAYASNGYFANRNAKDSVIIWNNLLHTNGQIKLLEFSKDLYELECIIRTNAKAQKTPLMILCDEKTRLTMENLYQKYDGNQPFIFGSSRNSDLSVTSIQAMTTQAPYLADKLFQLKTNIWNEALTFLGIPNVSISKKERMISDEVTRAQGGVFASRNSALKARKQAVKEINKMFNLNIDVKFKEYSEDQEDDSNDDKKDGGEYE